MEIYVTGASAAASTELSAFDACLLQAGVGNRNLLYLSSVIPADTHVVRRAPPPGSAPWGSCLYCVVAQRRTSTVGHEAWAGVGWVQESSSGRGLFVEARGSSESEVQLQLQATLVDMVDRRPDRTWGAAEFELAGALCTGAPVCALVVAAYPVPPWV